MSAELASVLFTVEPILFKTYTTSTIITEEFLYSNRARKSFEPRFYWTDFFYAELGARYIPQQSEPL